MIQATTITVGGLHPTDVTAPETSARVEQSYTTSSASQPFQPHHLQPRVVSKSLAFRMSRKLGCSTAEISSRDKKTVGADLCGWLDTVGQFCRSSRELDGKDADQTV